MKKLPITSKSSTRTAKQWGWQFLRRNKNYQDAFSVMSRLNSEQNSLLQALIFGQVFEFDRHLKVLETFPVVIFDAQNLSGLKNKHKTIFDYLKDIGAYDDTFKVEWGGVAEHLHLVMLEKYRLQTYLMSRWIDPICEELNDADEQSLGCLVPKIDHALLQLDIKTAHAECISDSFQDLLPTKYLKTGKNGVHFFNVRLAKKWQAAIQKISRRESLAKADPTQLDSDVQTDVTFDLSLPIKAQLIAIENNLKIHQSALIDAGLVAELPSRSNRNNVFAIYIAILDFNEQGLSDLEIVVRLKALVDETYTDAQGLKHKSYYDPKKPDRIQVQDHTTGIRKQLERARHLRDLGYRSLVLQVD